VLRRLSIGLFAPALTLAGCGAAHGSRTEPTATASHRSGGVQRAACSSGMLRLALTQPLSPQTGERGRVFALVNRGGETCMLEGTPRVALYHGRRSLPFLYRFSAGHPERHYSSSAPVRAVILRPGASGYFLVAKYRCDAGIAAEASGMRVRLPGVAGALLVALPEGGGGFGVSALDQCRNFPGERSLSPGNRIDVSAVTASESETLGKAE
jgi:hypothetical protein